MSERRPTTPDGGANTAGSAGGSTRRGFLAGLGTAGALAGGLTGCVSLGAVGGGDGRPVSILAAGSLQRTLGEGLREAVDVPITVEAHGSVTAARLVASGRRDPDLLVLADAALFERILDAPWYATVATNALAVAHAERPTASAVATADRWYDPILAGDVSLGRTDPALDPLGYRTVFAFALGERFYGRPALRRGLLDAASIYPETSLVSRLEAGVVDAAVVYRSMAVERGYPRVDLPAAIDLSDPSRSYDAASYELDDGTVLRGAPIRYGAWARHETERVGRVFATLVAGDVLDDHGFATPAPLPTVHGEVPAVFDGVGSSEV